MYPVGVLDFLVGTIEVYFSRGRATFASAYLIHSSILSADVQVEKLRVSGYAGVPRSLIFREGAMMSNGELSDVAIDRGHVEVRFLVD